MSQPTSRLRQAEPSVTAIVSAYNESDILPATVGALVEQGISVYLLDNRSTDGTADSVRSWLGRGLLAIEEFPAEPGADRFDWSAILRRKEELAAELEADWFIHHDADEFRESPWPGLGLRQAIGLVDRLGYNAIDFAVYNFWPSDDSFRPGDDPRVRLPGYLPGEAFDRVQIKCWKRQGGQRVDLVHVGGHDVQFPGRRVFPIRFPMRHYPLRGREHARRKIHLERLPRFVADERAKGWHVQYDQLPEDVVRAREQLQNWDPEAVAVELQIRNRKLEETEAMAADAVAAERDRARSEADEARRERDQARSEADEIRRERDHARSERDAAKDALLGSEARLDVAERELADHRLRSQALVELIETRERELDAARERALELDSSVSDLRGELDRSAAALQTEHSAHAATAQRLSRVLDSRSWRLTAPLRRALDTLRRLRR